MSSIPNIRKTNLPVGENLKEDHLESKAESHICHPVSLFVKLLVFGPLVKHMLCYTFHIFGRGLRVSPDSSCLSADVLACNLRKLY